MTDYGEIEVEPGMLVIYFLGGEHRVGKVIAPGVPDDSVLLSAGLSLHISDIEAVGIYGDQAKFVLPERDDEDGDTE